MLTSFIVMVCKFVAQRVLTLVVGDNKLRGATETKAREFNRSVATALERHGTARIHQVRYEDLFADPCR